MTVANYTYDAFGNHKVYDADWNENTTPNFIGNINPIRYRGYYYDTETSLYFVQGRYYDTEIGRFISTKNAYAIPHNSKINNFYSYANDNPICITYSNYVTSVDGDNLTATLIDRNLPPVPEWIEKSLKRIDIVSSLISPIRTSIATFKYTNLWDLMRLDGVTELPGALSKTMLIIGCVTSGLGGIVAGYEKYASGASLISSIAGGIINAGIGIGIMYASSAIATSIIGALAASSLAIPGGILVVGGALLAMWISDRMDYLVTKVEILGDTIEGHINNFVDWLIWWD